MSVELLLLLVFYERMCLKVVVPWNLFMCEKVQAYFTVYLPVEFCPRKMFHPKALSLCRSPWKLLFISWIPCSYIWEVHVLGFLGGSAGKESACHVGDLGLIFGLGRSPGEGNGYPLRYTSLENSMNCIVCGVAKSRTGPLTFTFTWLGC